MNALELCVWLNASECLTANVLHIVENETAPEDIIQKLLKLELMKQPAAVKLQKLASENWAGREIKQAEVSGLFLISTIALKNIIFNAFFLSSLYFFKTVFSWVIERFNFPFVEEVIL